MDLFIHKFMNAIEPILNIHRYFGAHQVVGNQFHTAVAILVMKYEFTCHCNCIKLPICGVEFFPTKWSIILSHIDSIMEIKEHIFQILLGLNGVEIDAVHVLFCVFGANGAWQCAANRINDIQHFFARLFEILRFNFVGNYMEKTPSGSAPFDSIAVGRRIFLWFGRVRIRQLFY